MKTFRGLLVLGLLICAQHSVTAQTFPPDRLDGPFGKAGTWGVIDYYGGFTATAPASNVILQLQDIQSGGLEADSATVDLPWLDVTDPDTNANGGPALNNALGDGMFPYASDNLTVSAPDDNDMISLAHARIRVAEPGDYTFNVHSDDGFAFRIFGAEFSAVQGNGTLDPDSANTILHAADTGDSNTQGVVNLNAGVYDLEFMSWERGGGAFYELTAAKGNFVAGVAGMQAQYLAVGDPSVLNERTVFPEAGFGQLTKPLDIYNINNIVPGDGIEALRLDLLDRIAEGSTDAASNDGEVFVIDDNNIAASGCPFGVFPHDGNVVQFPNTSGNLDNFATAIFGSFKIDDGDDTTDETLTVSVHVDSDDRSLFHIIGESFSDIDAQELFEIDGDEAMFGDVDTCNTDYTGLIELKEGVEYNFEAFHVENGGDAGMQVLFANGDYLFDRDQDAFMPLALPGGTGVTYARNVGFTLVDEMGGGLRGDFNNDGTLDAADIDALTAQSAGGQNNAAYDLNGDAVVDVNDVNEWISASDIYNSYSGDANLDHEFSSSDLVTVLSAGKYELDEAAVWTQGDFNGDGRFDTSDLVTALSGGGYEVGPKAAVSAVPEPSSLVLILMGTLAAFGSARRKTN